MRDCCFYESYCITGRAMYSATVACDNAGPSNVLVSAIVGHRLLLDVK
jgi:hypothetical protein